jgi:hypothetical protein
MPTWFARTMLGTLAGILFAIGLLTTPVGAIVGWMFLAAIAGTVASMAVSSPPAKYARNLEVAPGRAGLGVGVGVFTGCMALSGMVAILGSASLPVLLVIVAGAGVWYWRRSRRRGEHPAGKIAVPAAVEAPNPELPSDLQECVDHPGEFATEALCAAWRKSYVLLLRTSDKRARDKIVDLRRRLLDELEGRDREGFTRWMESGARAGSDPSRYLTP